MPSSAGPNIAGENNLVFAYDLGDSVNSYKGEPTTNNYGSNFRDFTGTGYSPNGEWTSEPTRFTKTYFPNLPTPIGPGATLIEESGVSGFHHLSRYGGGDESGAHTLSCYLFPQSTGITEFCIGLLGDGGNMIVFNLDTRQVSYGGGIANGNAIIQDVPGWPGWIRVGANFEGRSGGWVGTVGYRQYTTYTGTAGGKKCYITGIQYEYQTHPTPFTTGTRSVTQGLVPLVSNYTIDLTNASYNSNAQISLDATNDYIKVAQNSNFYTNDWTWEMVVKFTANTGTYQGLVWAEGATGGGSGYQYLLTIYNNAIFHYRIYNTTTGWANTDTANITFNPLLYNHIVWQFSNGTTKIYVNGILFHTNTSRGPYSGGSDSPMFLGARNDGFGGAPILPAIYRFYNRALTSSEVAQNYLAYKSRFNLT